ncbi:hypothetical protein H9J55_004321 [Escherichia coli]|nr:hypothetical protein [Escherichia coli]
MPYQTTQIEQHFGLSIYQPRHDLPVWKSRKDQA